MPYTGDSIDVRFQPHKQPKKKAIVASLPRTLKCFESFCNDSKCNTRNSAFYGCIAAFKQERISQILSIALLQFRELIIMFSNPE